MALAHKLSSVALSNVRRFWCRKSDYLHPHLQGTTSFFSTNVARSVARKSIHLHPHLRGTTVRSLSTTGLLQRALKMIQNDPFVKLSLSLCVLIVGGTLVMELYNKLKKNTAPTVFMLPFGFAHHSVKRESLLLQLHARLQKLRSQSKSQVPVLYVTGPPASGKTELIRQFCKHYVDISKKWFGYKSVSPVVMCLDAGSPQLLHLSLIEAASNLGLYQPSTTDDAFSSILLELSTRKLPWLLVVDNLTGDTKSCFQALTTKYLSKSSHGNGAILVTTNSTLEEQADHSLHIGARLSLEQSLELLEGVSSLQSCSKMPSAMKLLEVLQYNPMAIALAAATIKINCSFPATSDWQTVFTKYCDVLVHSLEEQSADVVQAAVDLYCEAVASDSRLRHTFDYLGSCDLKYPLLASVLSVHLGLGIYGISNEALAPPPLDPILDKLRLSADTDSYWNYFKSLIPFLQPKSPSDEDIAEVLLASQDELACIRESPILSFKRHSTFEFLTVHSVAARKLSGLFTKVTTHKLDQDYLTRAVSEYEQNAWFKKYRTFDKKKALRKFHRMLPGLSSPGVWTEVQFDANTGKPVEDETNFIAGTQIPFNLSYTEYLHLVSHYHRVVMSMASVLRSVREEMIPALMKKYLVPHIQAVKTFPLISQSDKISAEIALVAVNSLMLSPEDRSNCIAEYEKLIAEQKTLLGSQSSLVADSMVDLADLHLSLNNSSRAEELLQSAILTYKQVSSHLGDDLALSTSHALSSLAVACAQLGKKNQSKELYEQALATSQSAPPSGGVSPKQRKLVSSLLVDVTHCHLVVGDLIVAKKYGELAAVMLQTVYPQGHTETVRLFNINSIVCALLGDKQESMRYHTEASKIKTKLALKKL